MDALAMRLLEIGEAVQGLRQEATATEAEVDWRSIFRTATTSSRNSLG